MSENKIESKKQESSEYVSLTAEFTDFEDKEVRVDCKFRKPTPQELSRANKQMQKDPERAFKNLLIGLVSADQAEHFRELSERYPGVATTFATEIYKRMGYDSLGK